ncbi:MAG: hypothetical protein GY913_27560 [Proteobacteria bacterium]|nr:hypothetical protein [Pseudomonadota bacterium]
MSVPFDRLGIPQEHRSKLGQEADAGPKLQLISGELELPPDIQLAMNYVLVGDRNPGVKQQAEAWFATSSADTLISALSQRTHPKILEFVVEKRADEPVLTRIYSFATMNDRTARRIARIASGELKDLVVRNYERLLMTPKVYLDFKKNPHIEEHEAERVAAFLRMQRMLPEDEDDDGLEGGPRVIRDGQEGEDAAFTSRKLVRVKDLTTRNVEAEIEAALLGLASPFTNADVADRLDIMVLESKATVEDLREGFHFGFEDEADEFQKRLTTDRDLSSDEVKGRADMIAEMNIGKKIKLAYLGNAEARKLLLRDNNKSVAVAVVKSGRMSDSEAASAAINKNLHMDVLREIASNREYLRKYQVRLALVNNPKTPVSIAAGFVSQLQRSDVAHLSRNKNVSAVISKMALKIVKQRTEKQG